MRTLLAVSALAAGLAQAPLEHSIAGLASPDAGVRLKTVQALKDAANPETALPLAPLVTDSDDAVQLEAIGAELNIFLAEKVATRKRVGLVVEKRNAISAETVFSAGPLAVSGRSVPETVLSALQTAMGDENPRVGLEAIYAYGALAPTVRGSARTDVRSAAGPILSAMLGVMDPSVRFAAARVMGRVLAGGPQDPPIDENVGDALIGALNDKDRAVKLAAMHALGALRYERAIAALAELFAYHAKGELAEAALDALAHVANPASAPIFGTQLTSKSPVLRAIAVEGLARIGETARLADLQLALKSERSESVLLALAFANTMLASAAIDPISEAVTRTRTRDQARNYLVEIAPGRTGLFQRQVLDPDARIRLAAVDALGLSTDAGALPLVQPLIADTDPLVARAATIARERLSSLR